MTGRALSHSPRIAHLLAQAGVRFRDIQVDVSPLRANAGDPTADRVQRELPGALAQSLAGHMTPGDRAGATLVARVNYLSLGPNSDGPGFLHSTQDTINGVLIVKGPRGAVVAKTPLRAISSYYPSAVDQPLFEESNYWRVVALAQAFAGLGAKGVGALTGRFLQAPIGRSSYGRAHSSCSKYFLRPRQEN